ncbi:MAG: hypothetical protein RLZZ502_200 [Pseudomonadota bacterium]|jgi:anthranilate synthase component 2
MLLMIDNYDSFTYNLVHYFEELGEQVLVKRNDECSVAQLLALGADRICLSPGPCTPEEAGVCVPLIHAAAKISLPLLGVCLGHQSIGAAFGGRIIRAKRVMHGKTDTISHEGGSVFAQLREHYTAIRYHSLVIEESSLPACLSVTARSSDAEIMGVRHKSLPIHGVQFHPESILTEQGHELLHNFLKAQA